jgi:hypothetical protein
VRVGDGDGDGAEKSRAVGKEISPESMMGTARLLGGGTECATADTPTCIVTTTGYSYNAFPTGSPLLEYAP